MAICVPSSVHRINEGHVKPINRRQSTSASRPALDPGHRPAPPSEAVNKPQHTKITLTQRVHAYSRKNNPAIFSSNHRPAHRNPLIMSIHCMLWRIKARRPAEMSCHSKKKNWNSRLKHRCCGEFLSAHVYQKHPRLKDYLHRRTSASSKRDSSWLVYPRLCWQGLQSIARLLAIFPRFPHPPPDCASLAPRCCYILPQEVACLSWLDLLSFFVC